MSTIPELVNQGKAYRVVAILDEKSIELEATLAQYDANEAERAKLPVPEDADDYDALRRYDDTMVTLNQTSAALLDTLVAILRTEG